MEHTLLSELPHMWDLKYAYYKLICSNWHTKVEARVVEVIMLYSRVTMSGWQIRVFSLEKWDGSPYLYASTCLE